MLQLIVRRVLVAIPLALAAATLVFMLLETAPGDPLDRIIGEYPVPQEARDRLEAVYGLDQPAPVRYARWIGGLVLRGDLGWSHLRGRPTTTALREAMVPTIQLAACALFLHIVVGISMGLFSALRRRKWPDRVLTLGSLLLYSMPTFWLGLMAILLFSYRLGWLPSSSIQSVGAEAWGFWRQLGDRLLHLALPASVLGIASAAAMTRFVRAGLVEAMGEPFVKAARARGLAKGYVLRHALRNSLLPVITWLGLSLPALLSGTLVVEVVFSWPGMGRLTYDAIKAQDLSLVLGSTLLTTLIAVGGSLLADVAMACADPRIRLDPRNSR